MWHPRIAALLGLALLVLLCSASPVVADPKDEGDILVRGFVMVPGPNLVLPLSGSAVMIDVTFGIPAVTIPIQVTEDTKVKTKGQGQSIVIADGDAVKIKAEVDGTVLRASRLELLDFPELDLIGFVEQLPDTGLHLPLAA